MAQIQLPRSNELKEEELPNGIELIKGISGTQTFVTRKIVSILLLCECNLGPIKLHISLL